MVIIRKPLNLYIKLKLNQMKHQRKIHKSNIQKNMPKSLLKINQLLSLLMNQLKTKLRLRRRQIKQLIRQLKKKLKRTKRARSNTGPRLHPLPKLMIRSIMRLPNLTPKRPTRRNYLLLIRPLKQKIIQISKSSMRNPKNQRDSRSIRRKKPKRKPKSRLRPSNRLSCTKSCRQRLRTQSC